MNLSTKLANIFNERVERGKNIPFKMLSDLACNEWIKIGEFDVLGTKVDDETLVFYDRVKKGAILDYHYHLDADEIVHVVEGEYMFNDFKILRKGDRRYVHKKEGHKFEALGENNQLMVHIKLNLD